MIIEPVPISWSSGFVSVHCFKLRWAAAAERCVDMLAIVEDLIVDEHLDDSKTHQFITNALQMGMLRTTGSDIDALLPPMSLFGGQRQIAKQRIIDALTHLFDTYYGLV